MPASLCTNSPASLQSPRRVWLGRILHRLVAAQCLHKQRQALVRLDDTLLRDIGVTRSEALQEANRQVWDAPRHWRG